MKNIHVLLTDQPSTICKVNNVLVLSKIGTITNDTKSLIRHNIYITSDEEIKEGDWVITNNGLLANVITEFTWHFINSKKIIMTTDQSLNDIQAIDDEFLEWFINNTSCKEVEIVFNNRGISGAEKILKTFGEYKVIIPTRKHK